MFIVIGALGVALLGVALLFDDVIDGLLPESDWFSTTAVATVVTAFGFGAAVLHHRLGWPVPAAAVGGIIAGGALGAIAVRWSRSLSTMATDATPTAGDLVGCLGRVVTEIPTESAGEVLVQLGGQPVKLSAVSAEQTLPGGTDIVVVAVLSPTRVRVEPAASFWA